jgi:hypothetical protein
MNNLPHEGERITFIEFAAGGDPYQVFTRDATRHGRVYDIEYSRRENVFFIDRSGSSEPFLSGPGARFWASAEVDLGVVTVYGAKTGTPTKKKPDRRLRVPDTELIGAKGLAKTQWFPAVELANRVEESRAEYCLFCNDWFGVEENYSGVLCRHTSWCDECGMWSSPQDRCRCDKRKKVGGN